MGEWPHNKSIGEMLVEKGVITQAQLDMALAEADATQRSLGRVLLDTGVATEGDLLAAIAQQMGMHYLDLDTYPIDIEIARSIPIELARKYNLVPVGREGDIVTVAMEDPSNVYAIDDVRLVLNGAGVVTAFATKGSLQAAIDRVFSRPEEPDDEPAGPVKTDGAHGGVATEATIVFTDIVGSTDIATRLDSKWRALLERHHAEIRAQVFREWGREVNTWGDEFFLLFRDPQSAIRCVRGAMAALHPIGIEIRAGMHHGPVEYMGVDVIGVAVHIAARVRALAEGGEILATDAVRHLAGGERFTERGSHELKGVPGTWLLHSTT